MLPRVSTRNNRRTPHPAYALEASFNCHLDTMEKRILIKSSSGLIPGDPFLRNMEMANIICRHEWGRDFEPDSDSTSSQGQYAVDGI